MWQRHFSSTSLLFARQSSFSRVMRYIPQPVKTFGSIAACTAVGLVLAPALIILIAPPLLVGSFMLFRRMRYLQSQLSDRRWQDFSSYHKMRDSSNRIRETIPYEARTRIFNALAANESNLQAIIGDPTKRDLTFTELESLTQDFQAARNGLSQALNVEQYGLIMGGRRLATIYIVKKNGTARIELRPRRSNKVIVVDGQEDSPIIDVKQS